MLLEMPLILVGGGGAGEDARLEAGGAMAEVVLEYT